jgi:DNA-binding beta-propeller fold protein YncE
MASRLPYAKEEAMLATRIALAAGIVAAVAACAQMPPSSGKRELMVVGIDEKASFDANGGFNQGAPGRDAVAIIDIGTDPLAPRIVATLPLMNTVIGPPTNLAITPDQRLALVVNSMDPQRDGDKWKVVPANQLYVIDLTVDPPKLIDTIAVGKQASGMAINRAGTLALTANRADNSVSVLRISGKKVELIDTVAMGDVVSHVAFTPDGRHALAAKFPGHKAALLDVNGERVSYNKVDVAVGLWPYNLDISPDGRIAITADNGNAGRSDGHVDTVTVIDLEANPPRAIDKVVVGDAPEGFLFSPTGKMAAAMLLNGNDGPHGAWFYHRNGKVAVLKIDGKKVTKVGEVEVRGLPEGAVFSDDGQYLYVGNYIDRDISILKVEGDMLVNTGKTLPLPGQPASMRGRTR